MSMHFDHDIMTATPCASADDDNHRATATSAAVVRALQELLTFRYGLAYVRCNGNSGSREEDDKSRTNMMAGTYDLHHHDTDLRFSESVIECAQQVFLQRRAIARERMSNTSNVGRDGTGNENEHCGNEQYKRRTTHISGILFASMVDTHTIAMQGSWKFGSQN